MTTVLESQIQYLKYIAIKNTQSILSDLVTYVEAEVKVDNCQIHDLSSPSDALKGKYVIATFVISGEFDATISLGISLNIATYFASVMLGLSDNNIAKNINEEVFDSDIEDAVNEIFNLANGSMEKSLRKELDIKLSFQLKDTRLVGGANDSLFDNENQNECVSQGLSIDGVIDHATILQFSSTYLYKQICIYLPNSRDEESIMTTISTQASLKVGNKKAISKAGKQQRVMVVESILLVRRAMSEILKKKPYTVLEAISGSKAFRKIYLMNKSIDLVIIDVALDDMSGLDVLRALKANSQTLAIPVIICSSKYDKDSVLKAVKAGASDFLVKPFNEVTLLGKVTRVLSK